MARIFMLKGDINRPGHVDIPEESTTLREVVEQFHPDRILIEPSGVGKLSDVIVAVERTVDECPELKLNSYVTVADASKVKVYMKNFGEFYNNQIEAAGTIILSRTQKLSQEKLEAAAAMLREKNPDAAILTTPWDELDGKTILSAVEKVSLSDELLEKMRHEHEIEETEHAHHHHDHDHEHHHEHDENCTCGCHDHHHGHEGHHHADEVFTSWGKETAHKYTEEELDYLLKALSETDAYGTVLRSKGIIQMADGSWKQFDMVPEEYEVREGQADYTGRVCVIGTDLKEEDLIKLFHI